MRQQVHHIAHQRPLVGLRLAVLSAVLLATGTPALSQAAGGLTPRDFQPERPKAGEVVFSGEPGLQVPPGAEQLDIRISDVEIEGALPGMETATAETVARLTRGRISAAEIFMAATDLEAAYADAGYVLARVVLPEQTLRDGGKLRLVVVNGFVEKVDATAVPAAVRSRIEELTRSLVGRPGLRLADIERQLLLAGDTYGVALGSALAAGATPGGTVIVLDPQYRSITGYIGVDNTLSDQLGGVVIDDDLGGFSVDAGVEFNGFLGRGEVFYLRGSGFPDDFFDTYPRLRTLAGGAVFPIGNNGLSLNAEVTNSVSSPDPKETVSRFQRASFRLYYPWIRSREMNVTTQLSFDVQGDRLELRNGDDIYRDDLRIVRAAADMFRLFGDGSSLESGAILSFGLDALGARSSGDDGAPMSRSGAEPDFRKLEVSARYLRDLGPRLTFSLAGRAQTSLGQPIVESEQLYIATPDEMSVFNAGSLAGDSGWVVRGQVAAPFRTSAASTPLMISPYAFAAAGALHLERPIPPEEATLDVSAVGVGVELVSLRESPFSQASLRLEIGRGFREDGESVDNCFKLLGSIRF